MIELIPIIEGHGKKAVSARALHGFLGSKRDFSNWIKERISKYGLIEGAATGRVYSCVRDYSKGRITVTIKHRTT